MLLVYEENIQVCCTQCYFLYEYPKEVFLFFFLVFDISLSKVDLFVKFKDLVLLLTGTLRSLRELIPVKLFLIYYWVDHIVFLFS